MEEAISYQSSAISSESNAIIVRIGRAFKLPSRDYR
jgi:hypothetical protein